MNKEYIQQRLRDFLTLKKKYSERRFTANRYKIKEGYMKISDEIYPYLENETEIDGFIIKKGYQVFGNKIINYLQVYTKKRFRRSRNYLDKQRNEATND